MNYNHGKIEQKWQKYWQENKVFKAEINHNKPKYYVLDMFPYPSGAGLHVGHPLGYIASDIYCRYKRLKGFNVLHPMGYDAFGLPAEQYAIQTGQHPEVTTKQNVTRYREQLDKIGLSFDWEREVKTCDPDYFRWTQDVFIKLFHSWYNPENNKAEPIETLIKKLQNNLSVKWGQLSEREQQEYLLNYRLAYLSESMVNWCPKLGTVLANDEVKDGLSVRGGHPVEQKKMKQWSLRITAYAQRLLDGLEKIDWPGPLKEMQRYWIGRSEGAEMVFPVKDSSVRFDIFTTRPDTIFGVTFMVLAPESSLLEQVTTASHKEKVEAYVNETKKRSERDRMADMKKVTGEFTGSYCLHPFTGKEIPIWVSDYVLSGYGTGAIMAVPAHDSRDYAFAKKFNLPIIEVVSGGDISNESYDAKEGTLVNSDFLNGLDVTEAIKRANNEVEKRKLGFKKINYKLRDAIFSRQRYWGEPFPIYYKDDLPYTLDPKELPLQLPAIDQYLPTEEGLPPLARAKNWVNKDGLPLETSTMPGFAGSSAYFLRYMDPRNDKELVSKESNQYWRSVDLYLGGSEHATGHLLYARFWNMFLFDLGLVCEEEPFKKLFNQGMIQGTSNFVYRLVGTNKFVSAGLINEYQPAPTPIHVDVNIVKNNILDLEAFKKWRPEFKTAEFILENNQYICGTAVEKMSKSFYNVVNPDDIIKTYGADTFRLYEMFLGPVEKSKPWNTNGIEGVYRFLNKVWALFYDVSKNIISNEQATADELKVIHKAIKKVTEDMEILSFNTSVSALMICVNDLGKLNCHKKEVLEKLVLILAPFAPHICEELWEKGLGHTTALHQASFPSYDEQYLVESTYKMPISFNGKMRFVIDAPVGASVEELAKLVMDDEKTQKWLEGKTIVKKIIIPEKIFNIVVK